MCKCTHVLMYSCTYVLMCSYTYAIMYSCAHVLMYSCTPLSVEPDLCEETHTAGPAAQLAVFLLVSSLAMGVTGDSDDGVLTSDT